MAIDRAPYCLSCTVCKNKNYYFSRNKKKQTPKIELNKFCKTCGKSTKHKEGKA